MASELEASEDLLGDTEDTEQVLDQAIRELRGALDEGNREPGQAAGESSAFAEDSGINRNLVMSIPVNVQVVLGSVEISLSELMDLKQGSTIGLDRKIGEPIDIVANNQRIARGEITIIEGDSPRFGVTLTEVIEN
jgi:flagellar motor switch protein FliN/FliY